MSAGRRVVSVVMSAGVLAASAAPPAFAHVATPAAAHAPTRIAGTAPEPGRAPRTPSYTGRVVVQLADSTGENVRRTAATAKATVTLARHTATGAAVVDVTGDPVSAARAIAAQPGVEYAVPERRLFPAGDPNDPGYPAQWDLPAIGLPQAWSYSRGTGVTVAVIDTGSLPDPDLAGRWLPGYDFVSDPAYALDGSGRDGDPLDAGDWAPYGVCEDPIVRPSSWHGIHVAGTIAAVVGNATGIAGIAPGSRILPLRALGRCGGTDTDITDAVVWAAGAPFAAYRPTPPRPRSSTCR